VTNHGLLFMTINSMVRNGYTRCRDGRFRKTLELPRDKSSGNGVNHYVETITRDGHGSIVLVKSQNKKQI